MKKIKVGVIPAAGRGNRIAELPLTRILPKPMLPVLNKPLLEYVIANMKKVGVETVYLIVGHKKEAVEDFFGNGRRWGVTIRYIEQKKLKGIAHAVGLTRQFVKEPFMVILGDDLTIASSLDNFLRTFWAKKALVVEGVLAENNLAALKRTCCVSLDKEGRIVLIEEKPASPQTNLRGLGLYLFAPEIFDYIDRTPLSPKRGEQEITDTIALVAREGKAYGVVLDGVNINVNTLEDLVCATKILLTCRRKRLKQLKR
jgi:dTDP-glucose pyrophosphorylase